MQSKLGEAGNFKQVSFTAFLALLVPNLSYTQVVAVLAPAPLSHK